MEPTKTGGSRTRLVVATIVVIALIAASRRFPFHSWLAPVEQWIGGLGVVGWGVFVLLYAAATVLFVPGAILTLAAGALFGPWLGTALVSVGSTLGASASFLLSRFALRDRVRGWIAGDRRFASLDRAIGARGGRIVFLVRLSPIFPFNLINYLLGLTAVGFGPYLLASWIGMLPGTFAYVFVGAAGRASLEGGGKMAFQIAAAAATLVLTAVLARLARNAIRDADPEPLAKNSEVQMTGPSSRTSSST